MNRVHPTCTERPSLNKECGWKGGDRSGLAHGQELTGRKRRSKRSSQEERKTYLTLTGLLMEGKNRSLSTQRNQEGGAPALRPWSCSSSSCLCSSALCFSNS